MKLVVAGGESWRGGEEERDGESNSWTLKRFKTGPEYFQLKETLFWGRGGGVILHTHIYTFI